VRHGGNVSHARGESDDRARFYRRGRSRHSGGDGDLLLWVVGKRNWGGSQCGGAQDPPRRRVLYGDWRNAEGFLFSQPQRPLLDRDALRTSAVRGPDQYLYLCDRKAQAWTFAGEGESRAEGDHGSIGAQLSERTGAYWS